ncbi:hypothetical protein ACOSQ2_009275 [Xanthoceras sorbifolium]
MSQQNSKTSLDLPWKLRLFIYILSAVSDASRRSNVTINRRLFNLFDLKSPPSNKPTNCVTTSDITVDASRNLWFRLYTPAASASTSVDNFVKFPVIVFFHGGGFAFLRANSKPYDDFCQRLARELPAVVISVDYRLSPEHKHPKQYEDGIDTLRFLDSVSFERLCPPCADLKRCFLAGDSAGANIAHHVALLANDYDFRTLNLTGLISIQPFFGGEERTESELSLAGAPVISIERTDWTWKAFLPEGSDRDHPSVNVFGPNSADISGVKFPTTIVFVGGFDPLQDWQKRYYLGLKKSGKEACLIEYPNAFHTFYAFPEVPESSLFIKEVRNFMQAQSPT